MSNQPKRNRRKPPRSRATAEKPSPIWAWLGLAIPAVLIVVLILAGGGADSPDTAQLGSPAPEFTLPTTLGTQVSLDEVLADGDALLYFSMGVGCDGCFAQIPEIEDTVATMGMTLVPVMVQNPDDVLTAAARFGIQSPILIDEDRAVSEAYGMLGVYGHTDRPSHSFALVGRDRTVKWVKHYAEMFVPSADFVADLEA